LGPLHSSVRSAQHLTELPHIAGSTVGQVAITARPYELCGIEFGRVSRKVLDLHSGTLPEERRDFSAAMDRAPIPEEHDGTAEMAEQGGEEGADIKAVKRPGLKLQIESNMPPSWGHRERRDCREPVVFVEMVHVRRAAARSPRAGHIGNEQKP
jgi:hypothetical protein